jgi:Raf kinase inhibitor-like YbhB/YbcL family protein
MRPHLLLMALLLVCLAGCAATRAQAPAPLPPPGPKAPPSTLRLASTAFADGGAIPVRYTGDGQDVSPPLGWTGLPAATKELALLVEDPDAPRGTFVHWVLYALPPTLAGLPEEAPKTETLPSLGNARQGKNDGGGIGYMGPAPPPGSLHHYHFRLYALRAPLGLKRGASAEELRSAVQGQILGEADLVGTYKR